MFTFKRKLRKHSAFKERLLRPSARLKVLTSQYVFGFLTWQIPRADRKAQMTGSSQPRSSAHRLHHISATQGHNLSLPAWEVGSQLEQVSLSCDLMARKVVRYLRGSKEHASGPRWVEPHRKAQPLLTPCAYHHLLPWTHGVHSPQDIRTQKSHELIEKKARSHQDF